ncbi:MAG: undecaprenyl-phosphate glucose phosphotransferase [Muribaculaceae bacterium]|nr:undecaprenyl-phosphate glucose phosphotransferase [Muribaculaceae bacterium]
MKRGRYGRFIRTLITIIDFILLNCIYFFVCWLSDASFDFYSFRVCMILNISYLISVSLYSDIHSQRTVFADKIILQAVKLVVLDCALFLALLAIIDSTELPLIIIGKFYVVFLLVLSIWWIVSRKLIKSYRTHGFNFRRVIIIGRGKMGVKLLEEMLSDAGYGYRVMGFFDNAKNSRSINKYKGTIDDVEDFIKENHIDEMYCTVADAETDLTERLIKIAENNAVDFYYVPQVNSSLMRKFELNNIGNLPALSIRRNPLNKMVNKVLKRTFDICCSALFLILSPIIFLPVAIAIKLSSPGPIFFRQKRTGYRGEEFVCFKFRTMRVNKDSDKLQATLNDPRKTAIGEFLRKTSIDELPQFFNVLRGDMSIVGPRPHMLKHTQDYSALIDRYMVRHVIKPGITGWAQVNGYRGQTKELWQMQKRVEYDVWYAENWNMMLDFKIIFLTVFNAIKGEKNAF